MFEKIYHDYLLHKNSVNTEERYEGKEGWYHASGAGLCSRKLYYQSIEKLPSPPKSFKELDAKKRSGMRKMGLGTIIHDNIQNALIYYNNIYNNNINNNIVEKEKKELTYKKKSFEVEGEVTIPSLNVRGFYDLVAVSEDDGSVHLIDFKTMASYSWSRKFGYKNRDPFASIHQELQLGTYGLAIKEKFGRIDSMWLYYYNKDNSQMRSYQVPMVMLERAKAFWTNVNEEHKKGLPMFREKFSPVEDWNCNYCRFLDHCKPPFFKKK